MSTPRRDRAVLAASEKVCSFLVARGDAGATVAEMARAAGLNERTFYRYFPTRHDAVRPVLDWGAAILADRIAERADSSVRDVVLEAFEEVVGGALVERTRTLFPIVFGDPALRAVLLAVYHDAEDELRHALSRHTHLPPDALEIVVAAATIVSVTRIALEVMVARGDDPMETLRSSLDLVPDRLVGDFGDRVDTRPDQQ
jgi:AcrR family transcriptional regulator